jgi:penicillin-binding protein 1B
VKHPPRIPLQSAVVVVDLPSAQVLALVGGRDYKASQYNRAVDGQRQIGSIVKPFVYWPALRENGPLTQVMDEPFEWRVGGQVWKPKNYDGKNYGPVPYFYALANSLNVPAARVGQQFGLENIMLALSRAGVTVEAPRLPSITLGAMELSPLAVAQAYATIGRFGQGDHIHTIDRVEHPGGEVLFERAPSKDLVLESATTAILVGMMRTTLELGSARAVRSWGLKGDFAGKTGSTSDTKDAWFVGFNSRLLTVVWVGYDDNTAMGLTGAGAALPIWTELNKHLQDIFQAGTFPWPEGVERRSVSREELLREFPGLKDLPETVELVFRNWAN